jgi:hypothetical protein
VLRFVRHAAWREPGAAERSGHAVLRPVAERSLFERTEIEVGWYAGEELFFSVAQPLGGGVPRIVVEWRFSENWILEARAQSRFDSQQFGLYRGTNLDTEQTYGIFLFREWAFP